LFPAVMTAGNATRDNSVHVPYLGYGYSSTNSDLPNTNTNQDLLSSEWMAPNNFSRNVIDWLSVNATLEDILTLVPQPNPLDLIKPPYLEQALNASTMGSSFCDLAQPGVSDLLCEAIRDNILMQELENVTFQVTLCHSREDSLFPYDVNVPDVTQLPKVGFFSLSGVSPTGDHREAGIFCLFGQIVPFTTPGFNTNEILPLEDEGTCEAPSSAPSAIPTPAPTSHAVAFVPTTTTTLLYTLAAMAFAVIV